MSNSRLSVVVGGQFGSEGKGAISAHLCSDQLADNIDQRVYAVRVAGPNAGHTVYGGCPQGCSPLADGHLPTGSIMQHAWKLRQVPVAAVTNLSARLLIAAGSEIDPLVLAEEVRQLDAAGYQVSDRLIIDAQATVLLPKHRRAEQQAGLTVRIGSTGKGIGAARSDRIMRTAPTFRDWRQQALQSDPYRYLGPEELANRDEQQQWTNALAALRGIGSTNTARLLNAALRDNGNHVLVEGTQGFGLGLHTDFYPQSTSSDARAVDFLAMAGINTWSVSDPASNLRVWVVMRTYPIRVAGNSGPLAGETSWRALHLPEERTTVTNKIRRVGTWDPLLARDAIEANGGPSPCVQIALTMADHAIPALAGRTSLGEFADDSVDLEHQLDGLLDAVQSDCLGVRPTLVGTGPTTLIDLQQRVPSEA